MASIFCCKFSGSAFELPKPLLATFFSLLLMLWRCTGCAVGVNSGGENKAEDSKFSALFLTCRLLETSLFRSLLIDRRNLGLIISDTNIEYCDKCIK